MPLRRLWISGDYGLFAEEANFNKFEPFKVVQLANLFNEPQERSEQLMPASTIHTLDPKSCKGGRYRLNLHDVVSKQDPVHKFDYEAELVRLVNHIMLYSDPHFLDYQHVERCIHYWLLYKITPHYNRLNKFFNQDISVTKSSAFHSPPWFSRKWTVRNIVVFPNSHFSVHSTTRIALVLIMGMAPEGGDFSWIVFKESC